MDRRSALVLLVVFGVGVFLAGLELMVTAVALPSILDDLADPAGGSAWIELRKASWIINGYLLVYILTMPLAGRLTDLWGARRPVHGRAGRLHRRFRAGRSRPEPGPAHRRAGHPGARWWRAGSRGDRRGRAPVRRREPAAGPGVIGALTFLGMAAGPFVGAALLSSVHAEGALEGAGLGGSWPDLFAPAWRWVFFINVPIGLIALILGWAASAGWDTPGVPGRVDVVGALWFGAALLAGLVGLTLIGTTEIAGSAVEPVAVTIGLLAGAAVLTLIAVVRGLRVRDPFLDPRLFGIRAFAAAALVSLLTGYAFATAIIGGAVFVDRVLYGGPDEQRLALGALAGATALGALLSGWPCASCRCVS